MHDLTYVHSIWSVADNAYLRLPLLNVSRFDLAAMSTLAASLAAIYGTEFMVEQFYTAMPNVPGKIVYSTQERNNHETPDQ